MQIKNIIFYNRAPFNKLSLSFDINSITVLSAINGKGKTTILSHIMDSWVEMTRDVFSKPYEGKETSYYRVSSSLYSIKEEQTSIFYIRYEHEGVNYDYIDVRNNLSEKDYDAIIAFDNKISFDKISNQLKNNSVAKIIDDKLTRDIIKRIFNGQVNIYMPSYRSELPNYLNEDYSFSPKYRLSGRWSNELINPLEVVTGFNEFASWIMDLLLDRYVYRHQENLPDGNIVDVTPELQVWTNVLKLLRESLSSKYPLKNVRFGIARRNNSSKRISIINTEDDETLCPSIFNLSTGEQAILLMFGEIIRQGDNYRANISLSDISGVVLIDEIDKHLHIKMQKEVLPKLIQLFPNVQFIVSSHSPFLNMGLSEIPVIANKAHIVDLDNNGIESTPISNEVYESAYQLFMNDKNRYAEEYRKLKEALDQTSKPLVITEGKTDIKHIVKAMSKLGIEQKFDIIPEEKQPDGSSNLKTLIDNVVKTSYIGQSRKIIAVFDRDEPNIVKAYPDPYKELGNNVYALCIPCPQTRSEQNRTAISIEYMYTDDEIRSLLPDGTRLFFGSEFINDSTRRHLQDKTLRANDKKGIGVDKIIENNGGQAVYDNDDTNHLAKKDTFVNAIVNDQIEISKDSWNNFKPLIDIINDIINK